MTIAALTPGKRAQDLGRRVRTALQNLLSPGDVIALTIAAGLLLAPALALNAAGWLVDMNTAIPIIVLSIGFSFLLARSQYNELLCLLISSVYGACFALLITAVNQPGGFGQAVIDIFLRLGVWIYDAFTGGVNQDPVVFTLLVSGLLWFLGFNVVWHIFRIDRVWRAILPPAIILITNHLYYTGTSNLDPYLAFFFFLTLLLLVRSTLDAREWDWYINQIRAPRRLRAQFLLLGALFAVVIALTVWLIPQRDLEARLQRFQQLMQTETLVQLADLWNRLFTTADMGGPTTSDYYGSDNMTLGGAIKLGDQVVLLVSAPPDRRYYWKSRTFDNYDNGSWSSAPDTRLTDSQSPLLIEHETYLPGARDTVQQTFTLALNATQIIYTAPQALIVDLTTRTDLRFTPDSNLVDQNMSVSVIRPLRVIQRGESYNATSLMSSASSDQLRGAGEAYPQWVRDLYGGYLPSVTGRTIALANEIVRAADAETPYDQAIAIEAWLRTNMRYNEIIPEPPANQDAVDWFLFVQRQGYCNYYASSMVVMLRSLGVPARMAAGFAQGSYDPDRDAYVVLENDAHTWVEVYFPGYGWVEFEPTAAQPPLPQRDNTPSTAPIVATAIPSPTLTPSPLPSPTPTIVPTEPPPENGATPDPRDALTATPIPTPTPSPFIMPTVPPVLPPTPRQPSSNPFGALLPAIIALAVILLIVLLLFLVGALTYWWWEWRGMRGLSPVARAYARLGRYVGLIGIPLGTTQTPEERRQRIVRVLPRADVPVTAITRLYTRERYSGRRPSKAATRGGAENAWTAARGTILGRLLSGVFMPWRKH
ncbi:MAG: transglutaminase domain-containing protein [Chloroflexota bacterium]|nr:transglutaminase domain-containing protein [Chloroflexota bacterium]